jgi:hypothetical protein
MYLEIGSKHQSLLCLLQDLHQRMHAWSINSHAIAKMLHNMGLFVDTTYCPFVANGDRTIYADQDKHQGSWCWVLGKIAER